MESLATQTLVIFAIRTGASRSSAAASVPPLLAVVAVGSALPASPFCAMLGFLLLIEVGKYWFYRSSREPTAAPQPTAVTNAIEPKDPRHRDLGP